MTLKTAVVAPIPSVSEMMAVRARPGVLRNWRQENHRSCSKPLLYASTLERLLVIPLVNFRS